MALSERWSLALALTSVAFGCRDFDVCGTDAQPCESDAEAAGRGGVGAAGDGGQSAPGDCSAMRASCDRSTLNGCETDLRSNPLHCGACDNECVGVCSGGDCVPFELRLAEVYEPMMNVLVRESEAFFVARTTCCFGPASLGRYDLTSGAVTWLARDAWSDVTGLAASATRLYVIGDHSLYSMRLTGGDLRNEGIMCDAISAAGTTVAAIVSGDVYARRDDEKEFLLIPGEGYVDALAATLSSVFVARDRGSGPGFSLEEHNFVYGTHEIHATHTGYARALHVIDDFTTTYVVSEADSDDDIFELYDLDALGAGEPLVEFSWDSQWVLISNNTPLVGRSWIGTFHEGARTGLRMVTLGAQALSVEWPTVGVVEALSASETHLWFVDPLRHTLVSVDVGAMVSKALTTLPAD